MVALGRYSTYRFWIFWRRVRGFSVAAGSYVQSRDRKRLLHEAAYISADGQTCAACRHHSWYMCEERELLRQGMGDYPIGLCFFLVFRYITGTPQAFLFYLCHETIH